MTVPAPIKQALARPNIGADNRPKCPSCGARMTLVVNGEPHCGCNQPEKAPAKISTWDVGALKDLHSNIKSHMLFLDAGDALSEQDRTTLRQRRKEDAALSAVIRFLEQHLAEQRSAAE